MIMVQLKRFLLQGLISYVYLVILLSCSNECGKQSSKRSEKQI